MCPVWSASTLFRTATVSDLYNAYAALRAGSPILWDEQSRTWMLFRYSDVIDALRNPALSSAARLDDMRREFALVLPKDRADRAALLFERQLETSDPPRHTHIRHALSSCLRGMAAPMKSRIRSIVEDLHKAHERQPVFEVVSTIAKPLPLQVVLEVLGIDPAARTEFGNDVVTFLRDLTNGHLDGEEALGRIRERVRAASGGILFALAHQHKTLDEDDVVANAILIVSAGHRTTTNLIGSLIYALLTHRQVLDTLVRRPELIPAMVEEVLRLESPIQTLQRTALIPTTIAGARIEQGQTVTLVLGSANRDSVEVSVADKIDLDRSKNRHVSFGFGTHFCLGANLARTQAAVALEYLLPYLGELNIEEVIWHDEQGSRGLAKLLVSRPKHRARC